MCYGINGIELNITSEFWHRGITESTIYTVIDNHLVCNYKNYVECFPAIKQKSGLVGKHMTLAIRRLYMNRAVVTHNGESQLISIDINDKKIKLTPIEIHFNLYKINNHAYLIDIVDDYIIVVYQIKGKIFNGR